MDHRLCVQRQVLHSCGRTALVLSGGSSTGTYHASGARALYEVDVLPDILCDFSAGSVIASLICSMSCAKLHSFMRFDLLSTHATQISPLGEGTMATRKLGRFMTSFLMDVRTLTECMHRQCGVLTFLGECKISGKLLNVSVTRSQHKGTHTGRHALLSHVVAPYVVIWSAVSHSCSLPSLFTAGELSEKRPSVAGAFAPYQLGELWCDGSVAQDMPQLLTQLFGVDYLIASQVNPYVIPFLKHPPSHRVVSSSRSLLPSLWFALVEFWGCVLMVLFALQLLPRSGAREVPLLPFAQDYGGDVAIYSVESLLTAAPDYLNLVMNPSAKYISCVASGA
jgi:predicted acylesterase/phospholipase RssA